MRILIVSPNIPSPMAGASTRNYHLLRQIASRHTVSLLALSHSVEKKGPSDLSQLANFTDDVQVLPFPEAAKRWRQLVSVMLRRSYALSSCILVEMQEAIDTLLARHRYDVVIFESVSMAGYCLPKQVKVIIDQHNIEHELRFRTYQQETVWSRKWYNWLEGRLIKPVEIERCRRADIVLVTSEREQLALKSMSPASMITVVPNGVDIESFQKSDAQLEVAGRIIFTGSMDYYPNVHAVLFFAEQCWPLIRAQVPSATWQIVGKNPLPEVRKLGEIPGVTVVGSVLEVHPYLEEAEIAIAPLLIGGGTRLKILEAMAMRKAVVSTSLGCEGLGVVSGKHLIVADRPEVFAQEVVALLNNPKQRSTLGNGGRVLVEANYSWEQCCLPLLSLLETM